MNTKERDEQVRSLYTRVVSSLWNTIAELTPSEIAFQNPVSDPLWHYWFPGTWSTEEIQLNGRGYAEEKLNELESVVLPLLRQIIETAPSPTEALTERGASVTAPTDAQGD
jgi:hypothetical protein